MKIVLDKEIPKSRKTTFESGEISNMMMNAIVVLSLQLAAVIVGLITTIIFYKFLKDGMEKVQGLNENELRIVNHTMNALWGFFLFFVIYGPFDLVVSIIIFIYLKKHKLIPLWLCILCCIFCLLIPGGLFIYDYMKQGKIEDEEDE